jgi:hypothetical protein
LSPSEKELAWTAGIADASIGCEASSAYTFLTIQQK